MNIRSEQSHSIVTALLRSDCNSSSTRRSNQQSFTPGLQLRVLNEKPYCNLQIMNRSIGLHTDNAEIPEHSSKNTIDLGFTYTQRRKRRIRAMMALIPCQKDTRTFPETQIHFLTDLQQKCSRTI
jgi:hypothetical protein